MFKVKKIEEKLNLDDLKVNDSNKCKRKFQNSKGIENFWKGDKCLTDCCEDCREGRKKTPYIGDTY